MPLADIVIPDSAAARTAHEVAAQYHSAALLNHCVRSYLWAASYGTSQGIGYDTELLYVASLLHDIGLAREFDSYEVPFEAAGGQVAWVFTAGAGWPVERRERTSQIIVAHMQPSVDPAVDPEGHLLEVATSLDISGQNLDLWPQDLRDEVMAAYPRVGLGAEFLVCMQAQARRKPASNAARTILAGMAEKIAANPL
jgi:hypothetical protein